MKKIATALLALTSATVFFSCGGKQDAEAPATVQQNDKHEGETTTTLTTAQMQTIGVELGVIEEKQLTASLKANGLLQVPNQNKASINSLYSGVIKSLLVQPGNTVRKGQTIATVSNPQFIEVQSQYLGVNTRIGLAELEVKRQQELNEGNAGALKNLQSAEAELRSLKTMRSSLEQQIRLMGINPAAISNGKLVSVLAITSPISGVVSSVAVKMGSYVDLTTPVAEIVDNSQLHVDLFVYEKDLPKLKDDQLIHFTLTNNPGREYDAQIYSLGSSFEDESKAVTVHAKVRGDKTGLIDGMNITAVISLEKSTAPAVPTEAIVTMQGQDYIFIVRSDPERPGHAEQKAPAVTSEDAGGNRNVVFEIVPVAKGTTDVGYTEITPLKDIPQGARVVVKGAFFVLAKMTNTGEDEHEH